MTTTLAASAQCDQNTHSRVFRRLGLSLERLDNLPLRAVSAGLTARPGRPFSEASQIALEQLGVSAHQHSSQEVTPELVERAERIFCMTEEQCSSLVSRFPRAASKVMRLDPDGDLEDPSGQDFAVFLSLAARMQKLVRQRISEMVPA